SISKRSHKCSIGLMKILVTAAEVLHSLPESAPIYRGHAFTSLREQTSQFDLVVKDVDSKIHFKLILMPHFEVA
ncbi:hypothetical protein L9F63_000077, partial [Diploptera punctata]